jgi:fumarylacetoacetate (FAA) hydrolase
MRYVTFEAPGAGSPALGLVAGENVVDLGRREAWRQGGQPSARGFATMLELLDAGPAAWEAAQTLAEALGARPALQVHESQGHPWWWPLSSVRLRAPVPRPRGVRDFYAFEQHVQTAYAIRGQAMPAEWYELPVFYFSNAQSIVGPAAAVAAPAESQALDFELEVAAVVGRPGRDLDPQEAERHIFGFTVMNDWSARDLQRREMRVGLGPAKGKDFATSLGPWLVTSDELAPHRAGRPGVYDLEMRARINGVERSQGNWKSLYHSFGAMLARASADVDLVPGDVIGSGTVGSGSLLELTAGQGPWLQPGDVVELEIEALGVLANTVGPHPHPLSR